MAWVSLAFGTRYTLFWELEAPRRTTAFHGKGVYLDMALGKGRSTTPAS